MFRRKKIKCEICEFSDTKVLHRHHIIPRTDPNSTELDSNLAVICSNCHMKVHAGDFIIEGVFQTSLGTKLFFHKKGEKYIIAPGVILNSDGTATVLKEQNERQ